MKLESYVRPAGLEEALAVLAAPGLKALVVAGGTDLVPMMRKMRLNGTLSNGDGARVVLDLSKLHDLCGIRETGGGCDALIIVDLLSFSTAVDVARASWTMVMSESGLMNWRADFPPWEARVASSA